MIAASDGTAITSGTVNGHRSIDGGSQASVTGTVSHKGNGQWELAMSQADTNGDEIGFLFTHTSGIPVSISIVTQVAAPPTAAAIRSEIDSNSTQLAAILADTAEIGAAGAGLTAVPWNAAWDAEVQSEVADALAAYDPPTKTELDSGLAALNDLDAAGIRTAVGLASANLDTQLAALPTAAENADAVWEEAIADHSGTAGSTAEALDNAGAAGTPPTAGEVADAVWDEALSGHLGSGSTGEALNAAGASGDPWTTTLPGSYTGSQAGKMLSDILTDTAVIGAAGAGLTEAGGTGDHLTALPWNAAWDAEVQSEAADALTAYDPPTKAELDSAVAPLATAAALSTVDSNVGAILVDTGTTLDGKLNTIDGIVDSILEDTGTTLPASLAALPTAAANADAVWDEARSGHATAGTFGESFQAVVNGQAATGTLSTTQMTTNLTEGTDDHFNGRIVVFVTGALAGQATDITDYTGSTKLITMTALTEAPSNGDRFVIV